MRGFMRRTPTCALHVHVGMPDPESAIRACTGLRSYLPVLQGLAAHSPYWHGLDSGFASARAQLFRAFPRAVIPPAFADWAAYEAYVAAWLEAGDAPDYTFLWWDIRPHPRLGTVEFRAMDAQARLGSVAGLAALVHGLALAVLDGRADPPVPGAEIAEGSFRAGRDGLDATLRWDGAMRPLRELAAEAIGHARGALRERGGRRRAREAERILREGNGADAMRAAHAQGGMRAVLERLVARRRSGRLRRGAPARSARPSATTANDAAEHQRDHLERLPALGDAERERVVERVQHHARQQRARAVVEQAQQRPRRRRAGPGRPRRPSRRG